MMQRKKKHVGEYAQLDITDNDDDDGRGGSVRSGYSSTRKQRSTISQSMLSSRLSSATDCLPGVPPAFKLILLSFVGFALLVVLTAKGHHNHWHYHNIGNNLKAPPASSSSAAVRNHNYLPESLLDKVQRKKWERSRAAAAAAAVKEKHEDYNSSPSSQQKQQKQQQRSISFVESQKKLKKQLHQLLTTQKNDGLLLGVPISNRYLGEDMLPYPSSKEGMSLEEWTRKMEQRTKEIIQLENQQWNSMIHQYEERMKTYDDLYHPSSSSQAVHQTDEEEAATPTTPENRKRKRSKWPSPLAMAPPDTRIILVPSFGYHRYTKDAILVFAEGYDLSVYMAFIESLLLTGYDGDLVLSIAKGEKLKPNVKEYLQSINNNNKSSNNNNNVKGGMNIIAYEVDWSCYKSDTSGIPVTDSNGGQSHCQMNNVFGTTTTSTITTTTNSTTITEAISDPRTPRPVATARYELYWIWCLQYTASSWIMLIDARDTWFQLHPFSGLNGSSSNSSRKGKEEEEEDNKRQVVSSQGGTLHLYGENSDAIRIGTSTYNRNWLITAYGEKHVLPYYTQPVICSGSTIGDQIAIESYLRAMVYQFDITGCKLKGCDQGFHNYLYYSGMLDGERKGSDNSDNNDDDNDNDGISKIIVHEQGHGIINNLAALRARPLSEQGMYDSTNEVVLNWDGSISAVAHQYDRDKEVNNMVKGKKRIFESNWMKQQQQTTATATN